MAAIVISSGPSLGSNKFAQMWEAADLEFQKTTGKSLRVRSGLSQASLVDLFLARLAPDESSDGSKRKGKKATEVVGFVLSFVKTMGGFAASAASMVFGPADMCFNAFSFLIDIPKKINKVYDDLIKLFSEMSTVLLEFQVLEKISVKQAELDDELLTTSHNLLIAFVNICARYIRFIGRSKMHFVTTAFKSVFLDDECGVLDELQTFQRLARQQSSMIGTVSFKHILDIEEAIRDYGGTLQEFKAEFEEGQHQILDGVQSLVAYNKDRKDEILTQKALTSIEERLQIRSSVSNAPLEALAQIQENLMQGVCQWVYDTREYQKWIEATSERHLLYLSGDAKTGKSFLLADIARKLKLQNAGDGTSSSAHSILYYAFPRIEGKRVSDSKKDTVIAPALKCLALQYAKQNLRYAEDLKLSLSKSDTLEEKDILRLFAGFCESLKSANTRLYILLNGLDNLTTDQSTRLLSLFIERTEKVKQMPRILITGSDRAFAQMTSSSSLRINIADRNGAGIRQYVENEISKIESLQGDHPTITRLRKAIIRKLVDETKGNFTAIRQKIVRVGIAIDDDNMTEAEVLATLDDVADTRSEELVKEQIEQLEKTLNRSDIDDLNRMLPWLVYGFDAPLIGELEALLHLYNADRPVLPLEKRLRKKFLTIIEARGTGVRLRDEVKEFLARKSESPQEAGVVVPTISLQLSIDRADKVLVKRFLWDLTKAVDLDNPMFVDLGSELQRPRIKVDEAEAHFAMIEKCLQVLGDDADEIVEILRYYSLRYLPDHLNGFLNSSPDASRKKLVCQKLIYFFSEPDILEQNISYLDSSHIVWVEPNGATTKTIELLFNDALTLLEPTERRWVTKNILQPERRGVFLQPITRMVAKKWLQEREWDPRSSFMWIDCFIDLQLTKTVLSSSEADHPATDAGNDEASSTEQRNELSTHDRILRAANWGLENIGISTPDVIYYERIGTNFTIEEENDTAIEYLEKAQKMPGSGWRVRHQLGQAYSSSSRTEDARTQLEAAIEDFQSSSDSTDIEEHINLLAALARVEQKLGQEGEEAALKHFKQIIDMDPTSNNCYEDYLRLLRERSDIDGARQALSVETSQDPTQNDDESTEIIRMRLITLMGSDDLSDSFMRFMILVMTGHEIYETITRVLKLLIKDVDPDYTWDMSIKLRLICSMGCILCNMRSPEARKEGMLYLEECLKASRKWSPSGDDNYAGWITYWIGLKSNRSLSMWRSLTIMSTNPGQSEASAEWYDFEDTIRNGNPQHAGWATYRASDTSLTYLCRHYVMDKSYDKARELVLPDIKDALVILEDDDPNNDDTGYWILGEAFKLVGDDVHALAAWSLITPTDVDESTADGKSANSGTDEADEKQQDAEPNVINGDTDNLSVQRRGNFNRYCDGDCLTAFAYADDLWSCKHCPDVKLCTSCHEQLKSDEYQRFNCHPQHDFLHIPPWSDDVYKELGKDNVRIEGTLDENNRIVGGRIVSVKEWLKIIREMWSLTQAENQDE